MITDGPSNRGFSLLELLVAITVCTLLSGALAGVVTPARAAFDAVPVTLELHQRSRAGIEVFASAVRSAGASVAATTDLGPLAMVMPTVVVLEPFDSDDGSDQFSGLYVIAPAFNASQGVLDRDQPTPHGPLGLADGAGCPGSGDVCGFAPGMVAAIVDGMGRFDVFTVATALPATRELTPTVAFTAAYPAGAVVVEVTAHLFRLAVQSDGSRALVRQTAGGATQPIIDNVTGLGIEVWAGHPLVRLRHADVADGPWNHGGPAGQYDVDLLSVRQVDVWIRVGPTFGIASPAGGRSPLSLVSDRTLRTSIHLRNVP